jgi:ABC-2 type transport system permease protein
MVFSLTMLALNALPLRLATYRELGYLRRLAVTPVQPSRLLAAQLTVYTAIAVAAITLILALGAALFHLRLPGSLPGLAVTLLLTAAALFPLGLLIASTAPTAKAAGAIGGLLFFALTFASGLWWPLQTMPALLRAIMEKTPTGAAVQALTDTISGRFPSLTPLAVLAIYAVAFTTLAVRTFRWE